MGARSSVKSDGRLRLLVRHVWATVRVPENTRPLPRVAQERLCSDAAKFGLGEWVHRQRRIYCEMRVTSTPRGGPRYVDFFW